MSADASPISPRARNSTSAARLCLNRAKASAHLGLLQRIKTPFVEPPAEEPARPRSRLRSVGEVLRERREELDLDLETIGATLRIKPSYLVALEQDRSHELPGAAYAIGFIKAYSRHLGLDEEAVLNRFKDESAGLTARPDLSLPVPLGERSLPGAAMLLIALILVLCGYGTWYYLSTGERTRPERVAAVPPTLLPNPQPNLKAPPTAPGSGSDGGIILAPGMTGTPAPSKSPAAGPAAAPGVGSAHAAASPPPAAGSATPPPAQGASPPATPPVPPKTAAASPATPASVTAPAALPATAGAGAAGQVTIKAIADCWIQVRGADNLIVFSRVLKTGEVYKVPAKAGLSCAPVMPGLCRSPSTASRRLRSARSARCGAMSCSIRANLRPALPFTVERLLFSVIKAFYKPDRPLLRGSR